MSQENLEWVREAIEAVNRGDLEAALDRLHPDVEWQTLDVFPDAGTYRGPDGVRGFFQTWQESFQDFRLHLERCVPLGDHDVLAALRVSGEGAGSGVEVKSPVFFELFEFRDGRLVRAQMFQTEGDAREAAGHSGSATW
jgi:ketosteroid isomerase-like protein